MLHWPATRLVLALLVLDICLGYRAERAGLLTAGAVLQLDESAGLSPVEDGKNHLVSSLRMPEFLGVEHRSRLSDLGSSSLVVSSFDFVDSDSSRGDFPFERADQIQPITVQILLCVWLI